MSNYDEGLTELGYCDAGSGYDWDEFHAWYDEAARIFYWHSEGGCSCNYFGDYTQRSDLSFGSKQEAIAALKEWASDNDGYYFASLSSADVARLEEAIRAVKVPK